MSARRRSAGGDQLALDLGGPGRGPSAPSAPLARALPVPAAPGGAPLAGASAAELARLLGRPAPTAEQSAVIEAPLAPLLVVAGAGSGKTETMAARVVHLVAGGAVRPEEVLGLTFTRKAAGELAERVRSRLAALHRAGALPGAGDHGGRPHVDGDGVGEGAADPPGEPVVSTYHAYAGGLVAEHGLRIGLDAGARLLGQAACWQLAADLVERWDGPTDGLDAAPSTVVEAVLGLAGECAEHLVPPAAVRQHLRAVLDRVEALPGRPSADVRSVLARLRSRERLVDLVEAYVDRKRAGGSLDFGDQVALAARLARDVPEAVVAERARYRVVLLDEYQDTSHAQVVLLHALFGDGHAVTAVGDPQQSVYGWRGASAGTLEAFPSRFTAGDGAPAPVLHLSTSWRNDAAVLDVANRLSGPLRLRPAAERVPVPDLRPRPGAARGRVLAAFPSTVVEEAAWVAEALTGVRAEDDAAVVVGGRRRTAAVLCRKRAQIPLLEAALRERGLPVEVLGLGGLLHEPEVADVVAALACAADLGRGDAAARLLLGPRVQLGARDLEVLGAWARVLGRRSAAALPAEPGSEVVGDPTDAASLLDALEDLPPESWRGPGDRSLSPAARERLTWLRDVLRRLRAHGSLPLPDLVAEAETLLGLDVEVAARPGAAPATARRHLDAFVDAAAAFADSADEATVTAFLAWLAAAEEQEQGLDPGAVEPSPDAVQVLTVHAAKGLEWDVVAVPGLVETGLPALASAGPPDRDWGWLGGRGGLGVLPHPLRGDADALPAWRLEAADDARSLARALEDYRDRSGAHEAAEERRLAYVAVTRARSLLLLSGAWWGEGTKKPRPPSRFLLELLPVLEEGVASSLAAQVAAPPDGENPLMERRAAASWPLDPLGARRADVEAGAAAVRAAQEELPGGGDRDGGSLPGLGAEAREWAREVDVLLAERDAARAPLREVELPRALSASRLVALASDPAALALELRRPVPQRPQPHARRGTAFHAWLEQRFSSDALVDLDDLPGAADADAGADDRLAQLQQRFLASEWADADVVAVEVDVETPVGGTSVRGRIDAVVRRPDGGVDVVDWKTGEPPRGAAARARAVQLAVYRLAWSRLTGVPVESVGAAFYYAATGETVRPALPAERELEVLLGAGARRP